MSSTILTAANAPLLRPLVGLTLWTFVMEGWMYATRLPAIEKYKVEMKPELTMAEMERKIPRSIQWKAENYNHLHEQPTVFYAVCLGLTQIGAGTDSLTVNLAWGYLGLRVAHSMVQATTNKIMLRFQIFALSSVVLAGLSAKLALAVF